MSTQYRRFINGIENFTRIKGSLFSFVVLVAKLETRTRDANTLIAINRGYLENGKGKGREGVIKVVDSSFRFTRVVRFGATGQFFVPREPLVSPFDDIHATCDFQTCTHVYIPLPQIDKP